MSTPRFIIVDFIPFYDKGDLNFGLKIGLKSDDIIVNLPLSTYKIGEKNIFDLMIEEWTTGKGGYFSSDDLTFDPIRFFDFNTTECGVFYRRTSTFKEIIINTSNDTCFTNFNVFFSINDESEFIASLKECSDRLKSEEQLCEQLRESLRSDN